MKNARQLELKGSPINQLWAAVIDCAEEVLRRKGVHCADDARKLEVYEEHANVALRYRVDATYTEAADMTAELVMDLIDKDLDDLPFYVTFEGSYR